MLLFCRPNNQNGYYNAASNKMYTEHNSTGNLEYKDGIISPEKRLDFVVSSGCDISPSDNNHHISNTTDSSPCHNYNNVSFARSNNNVCSMNYFSNLEDLDSQRSSLNIGSSPCINNNTNDTLQENCAASSYNNHGHQQINTIQMVRPIPKFNTFANGNQAEVSSNNNYIQPNHGYMSQGMSLPKIIPSGSEEELHRALPIYLPSEGESTSSLSCTSISDMQLGFNHDSNLVSRLNNFNSLNITNKSPDYYQQQLIDATQRQLSRCTNSITSTNESLLSIHDLPSQKSIASSKANSSHSKAGHDEIQMKQLSQPPPLPARLHPPTAQQLQQSSTTPISFFPSVVHQFPGRSVKTMCKCFLSISISNSGLVVYLFLVDISNK